MTAATANITSGNVCLLPHQKEGVRWMLRREEEATAATATSTAASSTIVTAEKIGGGLLADDMGLGKTYQAAAVIRIRKRDTLIVTKPSITVEWRDALFAVLGVRPWLLMRGNTCSLPAAGSTDGSHVAVISYNTLVAHLKKTAATAAPGTGSCGRSCGRRDGGCLFQRVWGRVILDEAHVVRNKNGAGFRAIMSLRGDQSQCRWALTGTPINNGRQDLAALSEWLRLPLLDPSVAKTAILRRTMTEIMSSSLPEMETRVVLVSFAHDHERRLYDTLATTHRDALLAAAGAGDTTTNNSSNSTNQTAYMEAVLRLRQACVHPLLYVHGVRQKRQQASGFGGNVAAATLFSRSDRLSGGGVINNNGNQDAQVVHDAIEADRRLHHRSTKVDYVVSRVLEHCCRSNGGDGGKVLVFCEWLQEIELMAEALRRAVSSTSSLPDQHRHHEDGDDDGGRHNDNDNDKNVGGPPVHVLTYSGRLSLMEKDATMRRFNTDPNVRVMLIQIRTGGTGLNLQAADYVIITAPSWNPCNDLQAMCRAYRQGQRRKVTCDRVVIAGTVEERCLELQREKMNDLDELLEEETFSARMGF